ncbi:serine/threonine protein kinase [Mucor velutinosus]|uniref:Serine/threonine protein kinase n=1 Tax=Mucor velutinosus TaxID=708070 RepID=A0AAN7D7H7_9FUNG|nr:serine/threonine protein kinase [Mucor velutinosus]
MSYSSSSNKSLQFNDYRFGEQVDMASTSSQSVSPRSSPQYMYNHSSRSHSSLNSPSSPLQSIIPQQQQEQYVQPLTRDMLEKKDRLDLLLQNRPMPGVRVIQRRRSICNGNIYRQLYNEDNSPMTLATPFTKMDSGDSDASVNSSNSQYEARYNHPYSGQHARHRRNEKHHHRHPTSHVSPSLDRTNRNDSNRNRSYGSITNKKQSTNSRSVNTSHAPSNNSRPFSYHAHPPDVSGPPRRFSGLVRLSAAHIALSRTRKNKKRQRYQSTMSIILHKLKNMASRVVNSRISEPADTKMSVEEMTSLSRYLYVLKHGYNKDSKSTSDNEEDTHTTTDGTTTPATSNQPPITGLFEEEELGDTSNNRDQGSNEHDEETSPLLSPSEPKRKRNLSSLGNIFPFAPLDRMPSLSRSGSESSQINSESDRLLLPPSPQQFRTSLLGRHQKKRHYLDKVSTWIQHVCRPILHIQQYQQDQQEHNTQIRFEGWSLFLFSPTSLTRLYLWKVVGARRVYRKRRTIRRADLR